ncbi:MAG: adenylate/guanylate cyclase domain-containing protein [Actinobacteria bacterium]|nr:adenylate/guanylate cyclase domain-containing protein [Actinomycetota bacterium]
MTDQPETNDHGAPDGGMTDLVPHEAYAFLQAKGVSREEVRQAEKDETLDLLVLDRLLLPVTPKYTSAEVADLAGLTLDEARRFWLALGFPHVPDDERSFTDHDLDALTTVTGLISFGFTDTDVAVHMARVIGSSMARIAEASIAAQQSSHRREDSGRMAELFALTGGASLESNSRLLDYVWRRHLQAVVRRAMAAEGSETNTAMAIGFADLVGFTALSQQLSQAALADVVARFEALAHETVTEGGGRVVKMIGDEVMFVATDPVEAAVTALALSEAYADDEELQDVRVGLDYGDVLAREGDYYGPVVNRASRMVNIARPGSVLVSTPMHDALEGNPAFSLKPLRARHLHGIGRVPLWALMHATDGEDDKQDGDEPRLGRRVRRRRERRPGVLLPLPDVVRERMEQHRAAWVDRMFSGPPDDDDADARDEEDDVSR